MIHRAVVLWCAVAGLLCVTASTVVADEPAAAFTFTVAKAPKTGLPEERLQATISRWSTDQERDRIAELLAKQDDASLRYALRNAETLGHLRWPGGLEYSLRYAWRTPRADGGSDVVLIADSRVWFWWDSANDMRLDEPFTVFHLRLDKDGAGEGKVAPASSVRSDTSAGVALTDAEARPATILDVRPQRS